MALQKTSEPDQPVVLDPLLEFARQDDNIRAVLMEGSRAFGTVDEYSDYDIVFVARNNAPYLGGKILPYLTKHYGEIAIMQTPDNGDPHNVYTHLVQFTSGIRIDLTFNSLEFLGRTKCESATVVLLDKDSESSDLFKLQPPNNSDHYIKRPTIEEFSECCNEFWWTSPYVAKAVARKHMLHALELMNECIRPEFVKMLSWLAGAKNGFKVSLGKHSTEIAKLVPKEYGNALLKSYTMADMTAIKNALDSLMEMFQKIANDVANAVGYEYNKDESKKVMRFIRERLQLD